MLTQHDKELVVALAKEAIPLADIADKFEVPVCQIAMEINGCEFDIRDTILLRNIEQGKMRLTQLGIERKCPRCGEFYLLVKEFWHTHKRKAGEKPSTYCVGCECKRAVKHRADKRKAQIEAMFDH